MTPGDIRLVWFPYSHTEAKPYKKRPVLIVAVKGVGPNRSILAAMITSSAKRFGSLTQTDVVITNWQSIGLVAPSIVRANRIWTAEDRDFENRLFGTAESKVLDAVRGHIIDLVTP